MSFTPGPGKERAVDQAERLAETYGGKPEDYSKVVSGTIAETSDKVKLEVHAFRNEKTGDVFEAKIKEQ